MDQLNRRGASPAHIEKEKDMKAILKLDKEKIQKKITDGNTLQGSHIMAVAPDGSAYSIHWIEGDRIWSPRPPEDWERIGVPALFDAGSGEEYEMACDILRDELDDGEKSDALIEKLSDDDIDIVAYVEETYLESWKAWMAERIDWYLEAFLAACNGDGTDLNQKYPWGYKQEGPDFDYEANESPAQFEWA